VAGHLHLLTQPSMRLYVLAWQLKRAGLDWQSYVLQRCLAGPALLVAQVKADPQYATEAERVKAFVAAGGGCRATYFNHAKKLSAGQAAVPKLVLKGQPPVITQAGLDHLGWLRRRFGKLGNG
jgi:hypothetical protein